MGLRFLGPSSQRQTRWQGGNRAFLSNHGGHAHPPPESRARHPHPHRDLPARREGSSSHYRTYWVSRALVSSSSRAPLRPARPSAAPRGGSNALGAHKGGAPAFSPGPRASRAGPPQSPRPRWTHTPQLSQRKGQQTMCPAGNVAVHAPVTQRRGRDEPAAHPYSQRAVRKRGGARRKGAGAALTCSPIGHSLSRLCAGPGRKCAEPVAFPFDAIPKL